MAALAKLARLPAKQREQAEPGEGAAELGAQAADGADLDGDGREVGEARQRERDDHDRDRRQVVDVRAERRVGNELVEDRLLADVRARFHRLAPGHAQQPGERGQRPAQQLLEGQPVVIAEPASDRAENPVGHRDERHERDEQGADGHGDTAPGQGAPADGVDRVGRLLVAHRADVDIARGAGGRALVRAPVGSAPVGSVLGGRALVGSALVGARSSAARSSAACFAAACLAAAARSAVACSSSRASAESGQMILAISSPAGAFMTVAASRYSSGAPSRE